MSAQSLFSGASPQKPSQAFPPHKSSLGFYLRLSSIWLSISSFRWALALVIGIAWYVRARNPHFSSAYMDESIYVLYGRMFLAHHFESPIDQPLHFSFGWYLWPILAAWADRIRGLVGVRELAAALGTLTVCSVYAFARRLYSPAVGLASAFVFALLGPAVLASRIATRDSGSIFFFAVGLWLFSRAWQEQEWPSWIASSLCMFAAFLCKYLIAVYFPFFVILTFWKGRRAVLTFSLSLGVFCGVYGFYLRNDLLALLQYAHAYNALRAPAAQALQIYFTHRLDFWILFVLSLFAWPRDKENSPWKAAMLSTGTVIIPIFQFLSRPDYDYWKHVNYALLFLVPLAMYGLLRLVRTVAPTTYALSGAIIVSLLAVSLGWLGNAWRIDRFLFWPNAEPAAAFFEGHLASTDRVLVDDTVFRYYFSPPLHQWQIVDPFYFRYGSQTGGAAYASAAHDGLFDYIVLDGGIGDDAKRLRAAVAPELAVRYVLRVSMPDPVLGQPIEVYERQNPPAIKWESARPQIQITAPAAGALVRTQNKATMLTAVVDGIQPGDYALVDVFTNRWYPQSEKIRPGAPDGSFSQMIYLAGEGREQCYHIVRVRVFDSRGDFLTAAMNFNIARANADGTASCR